MSPTLVLALASISLGAVAQFLLKVGVNSMGGFRIDPQRPVVSIMQAFLQPHILIGIVIFVSSMVIWLMVISRMDLSRAYPMISVSYIIITVLSRFILGESITLVRLGGICVILVGVVLINL